MPTLPLNALMAINAEEADTACAALLLIVDGATTLRYTTSDKTRLSDDPLSWGIVSNGATYLYALMHAVLPNDNEEGPLTTSIVLENVSDEDIGAKVRALNPKTARMTLSLILTAHPDEVLHPKTELKIVNRSYKGDAVTIEVSDESVGAGVADAIEPLCGKLMTRTNAPGLHR